MINLGIKQMMELYKNQFNMLSTIYKALFQPWAFFFGQNNTNKNNQPIVIIMPVFLKTC